MHVCNKPDVRLGCTSHQLREREPVKYELTYGDAVTEAEALAQVTEMGFHGVAFDVITEEDEDLHWHEFASATWVISGTGSFLDGDGERIEVGPGCHVRAPAGFLHQGLAGPAYRVVLGTDIPFKQWTYPIDKDPADLPASFG